METIRKKLNDEFDSQRSEMGDLAPGMSCRALAAGYAALEDALVVLSDLVGHVSHVFPGRMVEQLALSPERCRGEIPSIWEEEIFRIIHPDDLEHKMMQELLFFHYMNSIPPKRRFSQCLVQRVRMKSRRGDYVDVCHRLHYVPSGDGRHVRFALCVYGFVGLPMTERSLVVDTQTGKHHLLDAGAEVKILSRQELEVIKLIDMGKSSKEIAEALSISVHTVSRHRQNIIAKLQVRNTTEACRVARNLKLM